MAKITALLIALFQTLQAVFAQDTCPVVRYTGSFKESDHVKDHALIGRSYRNLTTNTVQKCFSVCINDCRCVSYQLSARRCELIDEDRHTAPGLFQKMPGYKYYELKQELKKSSLTSNGCSSHCNNDCCRYSQPCLNGGTCIELCQNVTHKFQCRCPQGFGGRVCEIPPSCAGYSTRSVSSVHPIQIANESPLNVYCDMTSEPGIVWTLIESFSLSQSAAFDLLPFATNKPSHNQPESLINWSSYRLSLTTMEHVKRDATHWRATCNYNTDGLIKTDYIRGRLSDTDILTHDGSKCVRVEYINVRGIECQDCTTHFRQRSDRHAFVDSGKAVSKGCQWDGRNGGIVAKNEDSNWCNNFGFYDGTRQSNRAHRCTASQSSTTQWWLGALVE